MIQLSLYQRHKREIVQMVDLLPNDGATIVVITNESGRHVKAAIKELRNVALARRCRIVPIRHMDDCNKLIGITGPIIVDWLLTQIAKRQVVEQVERLVNAAMSVRA